MKVAVLNFSGNVGKTTICANLFAPRMTDAPYFSVESVNEDASANGIEVDRLKGKQFGALIDQVMACDDALIDVGASNVEAWLSQMTRYRGSHQEIDLYVLPTTQDRKAQMDTVNTASALSTIGVDAARISVVFNRVDPEDDVVEVFSALYGVAARGLTRAPGPDAAIYDNEVYELLKDAGRSMGDVLTDDTDYRSLMRQSSGAEKLAAIRAINLRRLATSANENLDTVHKWLMNAA